MSVGVIQAVGDYHDLIPAWLASVRALSTPPDRVVLVARSSPKLAGMDLDGIDVIRVRRAWTWGTYLNLAVDACDTDWVAWTGVDDTYRPHALDGVDAADADVAMFGLQYDTGQQWLPGYLTADRVRTVDANFVPVGSPFRRSLWERIPFQPDFTPFEDWAFWTGCASLGARFAPTNRIDVDYAYAGHTAPPDEPTRTHIREWIADLEAQ